MMCLSISGINRLSWSFPNSFLVYCVCVQNGCLDYIRSLRSREKVLDEFKEDLLLFQEEYCQSGETPLQLLEVEELKRQVHVAVALLPEKCRFIFEKYLYKNLSPQEIADECNLSVNTI